MNISPVISGCHMQYPVRNSFLFLTFVLPNMPKVYYYLQPRIRVPVTAADFDFSGLSDLLDKSENVIPTGTVRYPRLFCFV